ncbi:MAG: LysM peptidoglycan-binding domain-containing M23 family metallopeptidase, partial [Chloroflexota bacterium]
LVKPSWNYLKTRSFFFASLLVIILFLTMNPTIASAQGVGSYTIQPGDTLFVIAQRFGISMESLVEFNNIENVNLIQVGQVLLIPATEDVDTGLLGNVETDVVYAKPGETLGQLVTRTAQDLPVIAALNTSTETSRLFPEQPILIPAIQPSAPQPSTSQPLRFGSVTAVRYPSALVQGKTGRLIVESTRPLSLTATWNGLPLTVVTPMNITSKESQHLSHAQLALLPVPALIAPQTYSMTVAYQTRSGVSITRTWTLAVEEGPYDSQEIFLPEGKGELLEPTRVENELEKLIGVWSQRTPTLHASTVPTQALFLRPIDREFPTTSPYGTRRSYNGGPYASYHSGQDFGAPEGTIIVAPADGVIALSEPLDVRGNSVLIDHGRGVVTGYWHLSEIKVAVGQRIAAGDVIGLVGTTGLSTGAHLHWELRVYGISVDPMQFLDEALIEETRQ